MPAGRRRGRSRSRGASGSARDGGNAAGMNGWPPQRYGEGRGSVPDRRGGGDKWDRPYDSNRSRGPSACPGGASPRRPDERNGRHDRYRGAAPTRERSAPPMGRSRSRGCGNSYRRHRERDGCTRGGHRPGPNASTARAHADEWGGAARPVDSHSRRGRGEGRGWQHEHGRGREERGRECRSRSRSRSRGVHGYRAVQRGRSASPARGRRAGTTSPERLRRRSCGPRGWGEEGRRSDSAGDVTTRQDVIDGMLWGQYLLGEYCGPSIPGGTARVVVGGRKSVKVAPADGGCALHRDTVAVEVITGGWIQEATAGAQKTHPTPEHVRRRADEEYHDRGDDWVCHALRVDNGDGAGNVCDNNTAGPADSDTDNPERMRDWYEVAGWGPWGRVVSVWRQRHSTLHFGRPAAGNLDADGAGPMVQFTIDDPRYPSVDVPAAAVRRQLWREGGGEALPAAVVLKLQPWDAAQPRPEAEIVRGVAAAGDVGVETQVILAEAGCVATSDEYPPECVVGISAQPEQLDAAGRRDFRMNGRLPDAGGATDMHSGAMVFTIDPATAKDLDDALSCERLASWPTITGPAWRVGVHIADVSHFVAPGTPLDAEAQRRGTTVYLVNTAIPMLPKVLCERHCSLNTSGDKYTMSVEWVMDDEGQIHHEWIGAAVVRSQATLSYEAAQAILDAPEATTGMSTEHLQGMRLRSPPAGVPMHADPTRPLLAALETRVRSLGRLAAKLRAVRLARGGVVFDNGDLYFEDPVGTDSPQGFSFRKQGPAHRLVEELMVLANVRIMRKCRRFCPSFALARVHPAPDPAKLARCAAALRDAGIHVDGCGLREINAAIERVGDHPQAQAVQALIVRSTSLAQYVPSAQVEGLEHIGLNVDMYTHFTSPIRRYADLLVHRVLRCALAVEARTFSDPASPTTLRPHDLSDAAPLVMSAADLTRVCQHINERTAAANAAERASRAVFYSLYLQGQARQGAQGGRGSGGPIHGRTGAVRDTASLISRDVEEQAFTVVMRSSGMTVRFPCDPRAGGYGGGQPHTQQLWRESWVRQSDGNTSVEVDWGGGIGVQSCALLTEWDAVVWAPLDAGRVEFRVQLLPPTQPQQQQPPASQRAWGHDPPRQGSCGPRRHPRAGSRAPARRPSQSPPPPSRWARGRAQHHPSPSPRSGSRGPSQRSGSRGPRPRSHRW